jgi:F-type H+-transporting ATPase subunit alpha
LENQIIGLFAGTQGYADKIPLERMAVWERDLSRFMETSYPEIGKDIAEKKLISDETRASLRKAIEAFNSAW